MMNTEDCEIRRPAWGTAKENMEIERFFIMRSRCRYSRNLENSLEYVQHEPFVFNSLFNQSYH